MDITPLLALALLPSLAVFAAGCALAVVRSVVARRPLTDRPSR